MATIPLRSDEISGVPVEITLDDRRGIFRVLSKDGDLLGSDISLDGAIRKARPKVAQRKVKVKIPFVTFDGARGVASGIHARNRTVLARVEGEADQLDYGRARRTFRDEIPPETLDRFLALSTTIEQAKAEQEQIVRGYGMDLLKVVQKAVEAEAANEATDA